MPRPPRLPESTDLVGGPYDAPGVGVGARVDCLFRDGVCLVTSWTDAPISWPRCRALRSAGAEGFGHLAVRTAQGRLDGGSGRVGSDAAADRSGGEDGPVAPSRPPASVGSMRARPRGVP